MVNTNDAGVKKEGVVRVCVMYDVHDDDDDNDEHKCGYLKQVLACFFNNWLYIRS